MSSDQGTDGQIDSEDRTSQEDDEEEDTPNGEDMNEDILQNCFTAIVDTLANTNPRYTFTCKFEYNCFDLIFELVEGETFEWNYYNILK